MDEHIEAVQKMQDYITMHLDTNITMADLANASQYSPWYSYRLFVDLLQPLDREPVNMDPSQIFLVQLFVLLMPTLRATSDVASEYEASLISVPFPTGLCDSCTLLSAHRAFMLSKSKRGVARSSPLTMFTPLPIWSR